MRKGVCRVREFVAMQFPTIDGYNAEFYFKTNTKFNFEIAGDKVHLKKNNQIYLTAPINVMKSMVIIEESEEE